MDSHKDPADKLSPEVDKHLREMFAPHGAHYMAQRNINEALKADAQARDFEEAMRKPAIGPSPAQTYMRRKRISNTVLAMGVATIILSAVALWMLSYFLGVSK